MNIDKNGIELQILKVLGIDKKTSTENYTVNSYKISIQYVNDIRILSIISK